MTISCLTCKERLAYRRGNCLRCYDRYRKSVQAGKTTWAELEEKGLALKAKNPGVNWMFGGSGPKQPKPRKAK
jgi:hypothetical protein